MSTNGRESSPALAQTQPFAGDAASQACDDNAEPSLVGQCVGKYRIVRQLGRGGMGIVYEAVHEDIGQRAAVKTLHGRFSADRQFTKRFLNEARAAIIAQHAGLVKIFDCGTLPGGALFILMEFLEGESLGKHLDQQKKLSAVEAARLTRQIAAAMSVAHERGIIHRDLKPDNIFIVPDTEVDGGTRAKILDFGLAKIRTQAPTGLVRESTLLGTVMGTPGYMAPEQCRGIVQVDGKADVYSLGVILFEMLAGQLPFVAKSVDELLRMHLEREPPALPQILPGVSSVLAQLARRMLQKRPEDRPSMQQIEIELTQLDSRHLRIAVAMTAPENFSSVRWFTTGQGVFLGVLLAVALVALVATLWKWEARRKARHDLTPGRAATMILIPGGSFTMGSSPLEMEAAFQWCQRLTDDRCIEEQFWREYPTRQVTLSDYLLDKTEVTNANFAEWLNSKKSIRVDEVKLLVHDDEVLLADFYAMYGQAGISYKGGRFSALRGVEERPITQVTWDAATRYCQDHGKRLPTEAEWEYAAHGTRGYRFPWGEDEPRCDSVVFARTKSWACGSLGPGSSNVGTSLQDRSPQGVLDLAGNVSEWVQDRFFARYLDCAAPCKNPVADPPVAGDAPDQRVVRGGDWNTSAATCRSTSRSRVDRERTAGNIGFRCAMQVAK